MCASFWFQHKSMEISLLTLSNFSYSKNIRVSYKVIWWFIQNYLQGIKTLKKWPKYGQDIESHSHDFLLQLNFQYFVSFWICTMTIKNNISVIGFESLITIQLNIALKLILQKSTNSFWHSKINDTCHLLALKSLMHESYKNGEDYFQLKLV